eukprot:942575_1
MSGSAKKKVAPKKVVSPPMIFLICKAIGQIRSGRKGASRAAISNYLVNNNNKSAGGQFNYALRTALKKGIESGVLRAGETEQRFKLGEKAKSITNPPKPKKKKKKVVKKKKKVTKKKKKKVTKKKKKTTKKKKKVTKKKKKVTKKKKTTKKKTASRKKKVTKKRVTKKKATKKRGKK